MTISSHTGGEVLYLSPKDLTALPSEGLTQDQCLRLVRTALVRQNRPVPPDLEVEAFPSRQGLLIFALPTLPEGQGSRYFSVTFS